MILPTKEKLIKAVKRDKVLQAIFNIATIGMVLNVIFLSFMQYKNDELDVSMSFMNLALIVVIYIYAKYLNNRIQNNIQMKRDTINNYEEVEQLLKKTYDIVSDGRKK